MRVEDAGPAAVAPWRPFGDDRTMTRAAHQATSIRGTVLEVCAPAVVENARALTARTGAPLLPVVKANAYGIGAHIVAPALVDAGASTLAVVTVEEGIELRALGIEVPIVVLGGATWLRAPDALLAHRLSPLVSSFAELSILEGHLAPRRATLDVVLAIDTGMAREGFFVDRDGSAATPFTDELLNIHQALHQAPSVRVASAMTHFAHADLADQETTRDQVRRFARFLDVMRDVGRPIARAHVANSAAALTLGARPFDLSSARFDDVEFSIRPGIALLGVTPFADGREAHALRIAFRWRAPVVVRKRVPAGTHVSYGATFTTTRETELAVLGVGYADGLPRALSNKGVVRVKGLAVPILGRVCMDLTIVDVTEVCAELGPGAVPLGLPVTLLGGAGQDAIDAWDVAQRADTIAYDVMNRISARVARVPVDTFNDDGPP